MSGIASYPMDTNSLLELLTIALVTFNQHALVVLGVLFLGLPALLATEQSKRKYDIPAGDASETLSGFVEQSDEQIFYLVDRVRGYKTKALKGTYSSDEALALILEGSQLSYVTDEATGAVMVTRIVSNQSDSRTPVSDETTTLIPSTEPLEITPMKQKKSIFNGLLKGLLGLTLAGSLQAQSDTGNVSGTVYNEVTGRALQGAEVRVRGTNAVDSTDQEGRFFLSGVPVGSRQLSVYYVGLEPSTTTVNVSASQAQYVNVNLSSEVYDLDSFIVVPQVVGQERAINQQKTASGIINIVSEEQFGAMLDGNIGQALQRLPGLSVDEDQDGSQGAINIRGIAGEYNSVQVDGNRIPTSGGAIAPLILGSWRPMV